MDNSLSRAQQRILDVPGVTLEGWDARDRPVVSTMVGIPRQLRRWAVNRIGNPADIVEPVRKQF